MADEESDNQSVESGSCTCSDYNEDCSGFYDSRKLGTSFMRFCILSEEDKTIIKKENSPKIDDDKNSNTINKSNEIKKDLFTNATNKRKNIIKITNSSSGKKNNVIDDKIDKDKLNDKNLNKNSLKRKRDYDNPNLKENHNNRSFLQQSNLLNNYDSSTFSEKKINSKISNFFPENINEYQHNFSFPIDTAYLHDKNINFHRSPLNYYKKRKKIFNIKNDAEEKDKNCDLDETKGYNSPRRTTYSSLTNTNYFSIDNNEKNIETNAINKNFQAKGRSIKEKIVKETKTITLEPGQTIKPKILTKRKLKPNSTIIKNEDGSQNIIIENTVLTTIIVNELIDSSELYNDKYPVDIQLVKQYITKIYKTEIINNPYRS